MSAILFGSTLILITVLATLLRSGRTAFDEPEVSASIFTLVCATIECPAIALLAALPADSPIFLPNHSPAIEPTAVPAGPINEPANAPNAVPATEPIEPPTFWPVLLVDINSVPTPAAAVNSGIALLAFKTFIAPLTLLRRGNINLPAFTSALCGVGYCGFAGTVVDGALVPPNPIMFIPRCSSSNDTRASLALDSHIMKFIIRFTAKRAIKACVSALTAPSCATRALVTSSNNSSGSTAALPFLPTIPNIDPIIFKKSPNVCQTVSPIKATILIKLPVKSTIVSLC